MDPDEVTSSYQYITCFEVAINPDGTSECVDYGIIEGEVVPIVPPFSYNNMCSSVILTNFIPVYIFVCSIQFFCTAAIIFVVISTKYSQFPNKIRTLLPGICWPEYWQRGVNESLKVERKTTVEEDATPEHLLKCARLVSSDVLYPLLMFSTFGLCSPLLAVIMTVSVCFKLYMWILFVGRFVHTRRSSMCGTTGCGSSPTSVGEDQDQALEMLSTACSCVPAMDTIAHNVWLITATSAFFFAVLCWDILGDEVGWERAFWAPLVVLSVPLCLQLFLFLWGRWAIDKSCRPREVDVDSVTMPKNSDRRVKKGTEMKSPLKSWS